MTGADTRAEFGRLLAVYAPVAAAVFAIVLLALAWPLARRRASAGAVPSPRSSNQRLELGYAAGLAVVAGLLVWRTFVAVEAVDAVAPAAGNGAGSGTGVAALTIRATASKWVWRFDYPGGVVEAGHRPDRLPTLVVPAGRIVRVHLVALDVVHAFWIPATRYKYDAIPGRPADFDVLFEPGVDYSEGGRCSEFCGQYHADMRFRVDVRPPAAFRSWLAARRTDAAR